MRNYTFYQVDAFTGDLFKGNPAAVMKLDAFLPDEMMQRIAAENNLSETAFVVPSGEGYKLRWFTPTVEVDFCGHATVATAHVLAQEYGLMPPFNFDTKVGPLSVDLQDGLYALDAPVTRLIPTAVTERMTSAFWAYIERAYWAGANLMLVFKHESDVRNAAPAMSDIRKLSDDGVIITARSKTKFDFVSRYFAPLAGINEDPVTGSIHAALGPYWAERLKEKHLKAYQASERGGALWLDIGETRLKISGHAVTYMKAEVRLPDQ